MIVTEQLTRLYGDKPALVDLDLRVEPGEILGFLGPNGAGKSTTVRILAGLMRPTSGRASIAGFDLATHPFEAKQRLGYVPETPRLYESLSADAFLDVIGELHHLDRAVSRTRRDELLGLFDLTDAKYQRLQSFSKGMRQKVVLAAALIHAPQVLLLDEPFDGLDANSTLVMKALLKKMAQEGRTILFSSHILEVVERVCTRIVIVDKGRQLAAGTSADICAATGEPSLGEAFARLTGTRATDDVAADILAALGRA